MVQLAKRALQTSLALPPPGAGAPPPALQQAAIASTSDCEARTGAVVAARRNSQLLLSLAAAPPPPLRDEEAVSSTTECEAASAASTLSDTGNVQQGNQSSFFVFTIDGNWTVTGRWDTYDLHNVKLMLSFGDRWHFGADLDPRIPYLWLMDPDADPTPFFSNFKDAKKIYFFPYLLL